MSTALPRPSRPTNGPPTIALPALPVTKTRKSTGNLAALSNKSNPNTPKSGLRAPSSSLVPPSSPLPVTSPTQSRPGVNTAGKSIRKTISDSYSTSATQYDDVHDVGPQRSEKRSSKADGKGNVVVSVRVRPDLSGNDARSDEWLVDGKRSLIGFRGKEVGDYYYDNVFTAHDDNARVYDHIAKRLVRRVMEGYHGTVFAYGMTGTGKTFSMQGTASSPGVIPLAITDIFSYIRETPSREFLLRVSYLEIYNEKIHDLLSMPTGNAPGQNQPQEEIKLREDAKRGVYATPLKEEIVQSPTQLLRVIARGDQARRTASTQFNARSSRSHAVVQIVVESRERMPGGPGDSKRQGLLPGGVRVSTLSLIDLAGSEKAAESKERRQEGSHINKSLLTLGTVIAKLSENKDKPDKDGKHLPYRDSKLTRLLQGALSGNSLVSILCTISVGGSGSNTNETLNTLKFASRAKNSIVSHAKRAEESLGSGGDGNARVLLERYRMEIMELRKQLEAQSKASSKKEADEVRERDAEEERAREREAELRHEEQMLEMQLARTALKERIDHLNRLILSSKSIGVNSSGSYSALGIHPRYSQGSIRSSVAASTVGKISLERTSSMTSSASTIGLKSAGHVSPGGAEPPAVESDDSLGEYADGMASLESQNRALQADLADKNRYIQTLEKRLLQARRASSSRASAGLSKGSIMVGEDHSVAQLLKEKDAEIAELRARLDDKDRMLAALRSAARQRDNADRVESRVESRSEVRTSQILDSNPGPAPSGNPPAAPTATTTPASTSSTGGGASSLLRQVSQLRKRTKSVDEMSRMLDEMIQDRVESGQLIRGTRGSVRIASENVRSSLSLSLRGDAPPSLPPLSPLPAVNQSAPSPVPVNSPPIQLQLLARHRASLGPSPAPAPAPASEPATENQVVAEV
ncbi:hypothetical protein VTJ49DRAFT_6279 [Mycothermus thermophilus]|uniref:Kinesin-like protein n=1 Tax=Humicola insolens TaxID=85995 RepID=A0ABR3VJM7_HUMIN